MIILIILISLLLNLIWFSPGIPFGSGESGILFINSNWHFQATAFAWKSSLLGNMSGITTAAAPTYLLFSLFEKLGAETFQLQFLVSTLVFISSGIGVYLLTIELFPRLERKIVLIGVFCYWFNPFSLVNIWNRFTNNYIIFFGLFPVALYFFLRGINTKKYYYSLVVVLLCLVFSFALTSLPFNLLLWLTFAYTSLFFCLFSKNKWFIIKYFLLTLGLFTITNLWWISQLFTLATSGGIDETLTSFFTTSGNLATLSSLSNRLGQLQNLFRIKHGSFFSESMILWRSFYDTILVKSIEFSIPGIILYTIWKKRAKEEVLYLATLLFLGIFLAKGNAIPFGEIFEFVFTRSSSFQVFRNPFEKIGLIIALPVSLLLPFSISYFKTLKSRYKLHRLLISFTILVLILWSFPFVTGLVFTGADSTDQTKLRSYKVDVPEYYTRLNEYFKNKNSDTRFILFPIGGEGITYNWENQYSGIELSASLFETSNIGLNTTIPYFEKVVMQLERLLFTRPDFYKIASLLNIEYIVSRDDIDWKSRSMKNPNLVLDVLKSSTEFKSVGEFGKLNVFEMTSLRNLAKIWVPDNAIKVSNNLLPDDLYKAKDNSNSIIYTSNALLPNTRTEIIKPDRTIYYSKLKKYDIEEAKAELLYAKNLPGSPLYLLSSFKENSERLSLFEPNSIFIHDLTLLGKRAMEIYRLAELENTDALQKTTDRYLSLINVYKIQYAKKFESTPENFSWSTVIDEFTKHKTVFEYAKTNATGQKRMILDHLIEEQNMFMKEVGIKTYYEYDPLLDVENNSAWVYRFKTDTEKSANLNISIDNLDLFYESIPNPLTFQINNKLVSVPVVWSEGRLELGLINLQQGINEIWLLEPKPKNLVIEDKIHLDSSETVEAILNTTQFDPYSQYYITFDYWIKKGRQFRFSLVYDNDIKNEGEIAPGFTTTLSADGYINDYKNETIYFHPRSGSSQMAIKFKAAAVNDCIEQRRPLSPGCDNESFKRLFDKQTEVSITNIKLQKVFNADPYFLTNIDFHISSQPEIKYSKISPAEYKVNIKNATGPFTLVFSELYNSGWKLLSNNTPQSSKHLLVNGYANAWLVDKTGDYELTIYFEPQKILSLTQKISLVTATLISLYLAFLLWKRKN